MTRTITVSPMTRVSGLLSIEVVVEGNVVVDARAVGGQFRGFEMMMVGRHPTDAPYFTQRVCGICSAAHGYAGALAADRAYGNELPPNGWILRNFILGSEMLQNQIRHFYLLSLPDFVEFPPVPPFTGGGGDFRLGPRRTAEMVEHYVRSVEVSRKCHEMLCVFGGKIPHQHAMVPGGVSVPVTADRILKCLALLEDVVSFIDDCYLPDVEVLASAYPDYFHLGARPPRFFSSGLFRLGPRMEIPATPSGVLFDGRLEPIDPLFIREHLRSSWLEEGPEHFTPAPDKPGAYTWAAAPRYRGLAFEVGPLARLAVNYARTGTVYGGRTGAPPGTATMDRIRARALEAAEIARHLHRFLGDLEPGSATVSHSAKLVEEVASAMVEVPRGTLTHTMLTDPEKVLRYNIITPTAWNFSPHDDAGNPGPVEEALIGTILADPARPVEVGRITRAFDPCMSCATHVIRMGGRLNDGRDG
ncbi:MAG: nickel-dependent hydrogenase large subunit [Firmicutes bacterium]|jgi:hydrogenase large subunit|nr:nickel-dependent hydrogenase large subunit [Bacillota bacterium]